MNYEHAPTEWKLTGKLRWLPTSHSAPVLQQEWVRWVAVSDDPLYRDEYEWRDVPMGNDQPSAE